MIRICEITNARRDNFGIVRTGQIEELVDLMRGDVGQYSAIGRLVKKPVGPCGQVQPMRAKTNGLNHCANGTFGNQLCGAGDSGNLETFGKID